MYNSLRMRGVERVGDLRADTSNLLNEQRLLADATVERLAFDKLHHQKMNALVLADFVDLRHAGMVQGGCRFGFDLEPAHATGILGHNHGQHLERHAPIEPGVRRQVHFAHAALAQTGDNAIVCDVVACR